MKRILFLVCLAFAVLMLQANELVYQDKQGVIRWTKNGGRVALYGANYCLPSACDYRAASYVNADRDAMIVEDLDHFKRMGWDGLRLCFWGDWQNTDIKGNLIKNEHLRLLERLIYEATKRGIYMLLSPIVTYNSQWPEMSDSTNTGFMNTFTKEDLILDPVAKQVQKNYIKQLLNHTNRYTGRKIKDEPNIIFLEVINEPTQMPDKPEIMTNYINGMVDAIKSTGCKKLIFYNVSQNFKVAPIVASSKVDGGTYAWYPQGLTSYRTIDGNPLLCVDRYEQLLDPVMEGKSKIVYEFDSTQRFWGLQIPAMVREFVRGGCQFIAMFSYDMLRTASKNLSWDVQFTNMVFTPRKAVSSMIAAEIVRRWMPGQPNGYYPVNNCFGDFRLSYEENLALLNSEDMYYHSASVKDSPKDIISLRHIAGVGSSPMVKYEGNGIYFLDRNDGKEAWTLELYPDIIAQGDPYAVPSAYKEVAVAYSREREFSVSLPGIECTSVVYPGKYLIDKNGFKRIADHPQQELYSQHKGWVTYGDYLTCPDYWVFSDWYTTIQPTREMSNVTTVLNACEGLKNIDYSRNFESPECKIRLIRVKPEMNNAYEMTTSDLTENPDWRTAADVTLSHFCGRELCNRKGMVPKKVKIWAMGLNDTDSALVNFMDKNGRAFGAVFSLSDSMRMVELNVVDFRPYPAVILPQDWPGVSSYYYPQSVNVSGLPDWDNMEFVQISLRGSLYSANEKHNKGIIMEKIVLEY